MGSDLVVGGVEAPHMMQPQEIFDTVVTHLSNQGKKSQNGEGSCQYRTTDEKGRVLKCAAGCLIPDDQYHHSMEGQTAEGVPFLRELEGPGAPTQICGGPRFERTVLGHLQWTHDSLPVGAWRQALSAVAALFNLNTTVLDSLPFEVKE